MPRGRWLLVVAVVVVVGVVGALLQLDGTQSGGTQDVVPGTPAPSTSEVAASLPVVPLGVACQVADVLPAPVGGVPATVTSAVVTGSQYGGYQVCRVEGVVAPQIRFVVELPVSSYRQRYLQVGCGGLCGETDSDVPQAAGCVPLTAGEFAMATNDLGHPDTDGTFGTDPGLREDFAYRADHVVSVLAKAMITTAYGAQPQWSYFSGCSQGGREGLTEAQRYPEDFDGVVAGAPALLTTELLTFYQSWVSAVTRDAAGTPLLDGTDITLLHQAVLDACDGDDGLVDGVLRDPRTCDADPGALQCAAGVADGCLDAAQVDAARRLYSGPVDGEGSLLYPGGVQRGSELEWSGWILPEVAGATTGAQSLAGPWVSYLADVLPAAGGLTFDRTAFDRAARLAGLYDAADPDLGDFRDAGGKLLIYHGWSDPAIPPTGTLAYYQAVQEALGGATAAGEVARLYLVPGLAHCVDGRGTTSLDTLTPVMQWVEDGIAPDAVVATDPTTGATRPVYPYPRVAEYAGQGDVDRAESYSATSPSGPTDDSVTWLGSFPTGDRLWWDGTELTTRRPPDR